MNAARLAVAAIALTTIGCKLKVEASTYPAVRASDRRTQEGSFAIRRALVRIASAFDAADPSFRC